MKLKERTAIPRAVRERVYERDSWDGRVCCVYCGNPYSVEVHHFRPRSVGGLGAEENLVCLCAECHTRLHGGEKEIEDFCRTYLSNRYEDWDEQTLVQRRT